MHAEYLCPGCDIQHGNLTDHPQSERKCPDCLAGKWGGKVPDYVPGKSAAAYFVDFLRTQAASGVERAKELLALGTKNEKADIDPAGPMLGDGSTPEPGTEPVPEIN